MTVSECTSRLLCAGIAAACIAGCSGPRSNLATLPTADAPGTISAKRLESNERVVYSFTGGNDGGNAATALAFDKSGNLYGTTVVGGTYQCGTIFKVQPQSKPPWPESALYSFTCYADGKNPYGGVTLDSQGNLYGTTVAGGSEVCAGDGCGVVYQYASGVQRVLHSFKGKHDGFGPGSAPEIDSVGNMFGTTPDGGVKGLGTAYAVWKTGKGYQERVLHAFTGRTDGSTGSLGALLQEGSSGNLYGVTETGGANKNGTVYMLTPSLRGTSKLTTLYAFKGAPDGAGPYGGLISDAKGNLYGTTYYGGANGLGTVFEMVGGTSERVLYSFKGGVDGSSSTSTLTLVGRTLYGTTTAGGGSCDCGTIFSFDLRTGREKVLHSFGGPGDGQYPSYGLTLESNGKLLGTTVAGGTNGQGTIFEFSP